MQTATLCQTRVSAIKLSKLIPDSIRIELLRSGAVALHAVEHGSALMTVFGAEPRNAERPERVGRFAADAMDPGPIEPT